MSYYKDIQRMFKHLESLIKKSDEGIEANRLVYEMTKAHAVSTKAVQKRLELLQEIGEIAVYDGVVTWKTAKASITL